MYWVRNEVYEWACALMSFFKTMISILQLLFVVVTIGQTLLFCLKLKTRCGKNNDRKVIQDKKIIS